MKSSESPETAWEREVDSCSPEQLSTFGLVLSFLGRESLPQAAN